MSIRLTENEILATTYRVVQALCWFAGGRFILTRMGHEEFGFVSVILGISACLQMFDFGITNYLRTELPRSHESGDLHLLYSQFRRALALTLAVGGVVALLVTGLQFVPGIADRLMGTLSSRSVLSVEEFRAVVAIMCIYTLMLVSNNMLQAYLAAFRRQYIWFLLGILGCLLQVTVTWLAASSGAGIPCIVAIFCVLPAVPCTLYLFYLSARTLSGRRSSRTFQVINKTSAAFLLIQLSGAIMTNLDTALVSHYFGLGEAAVYSMFKLVVQVPISLYAQFNMQSWPIYAALSNAPSRWREVRALMRRNLTIAAIASLSLVIALTLAGPLFVDAWSSGAMKASRLTAFWFSIYGATFIVSHSLSVFMFAHNYTRGLVPVAILSPPLFFLVTWRLRDMGIWSVAFCMFVVTALGLLVASHFYRRTMRDRIAHFTQLSARP